MSPAEPDELRRQLDNLLAAGHIEPSKSPFGAPVVFVGNKDGTIRMCVDYQALNKLTLRNGYPLPRIDELLDTLKVAKYFSKMGLWNGIHQDPWHPDGLEKTAFRRRY